MKLKDYDNVKPALRGKCCKCGKALPFATDGQYVCLECELK
jgi:hypothetical protein